MSEDGSVPLAGDTATITVQSAVSESVAETNSETWDYPNAEEAIPAPAARQTTFIAIDGTLATYSADAFGSGDGCLRETQVLMCPCTIGGIRSPARKEELRRFFKRGTLWIVIIQFIFFIITLCIDGFAPFTSNVLLGPTDKALRAMGAKESYLIASGQIHRFFFALLLHGGLIHIGIDIYAQMTMCMHAEALWGRARYLFAYFFSGFGALLLSCICAPEYISVGASGSVIGILTILFVQLFFTQEVSNKFQQQFLRNLLICIICMLILGFVHQIDASCHIGGVLVGLLIGLYFYGANGIKSVESRPKLKAIFPFIMLGCLIIYFVTCFIVVFVRFHNRPVESSSSSSDPSSSSSSLSSNNLMEDTPTPSLFSFVKAVAQLMNARYIH